MISLDNRIQVKLEAAEQSLWERESNTGDEPLYVSTSLPTKSHPASFPDRERESRSKSRRPRQISNRFGV